MFLLTCFREPCDDVTKENKVENPEERRCEMSGPGDRPEGTLGLRNVEGWVGALGRRSGRGRRKSSPGLSERSVVELAEELRTHRRGQSERRKGNVKAPGLESNPKATQLGNDVTFLEHRL